MEVKNGYYRLSVKALIFNETRERFLLVQGDNGKWELPGGGLDWGEKPADGIIREIKEEMDLEVKSVAKHPSYLITAQRDSDGQWTANAVYESTLKDLVFTPSSECQALKFVTKEETEDMDLFIATREFVQVFNQKDLHNKLA